MLASASARAPAPVHATTCEREVAETKLKLGICLAYGSPRTTPSAGATQNPLSLLGRRIEGVTPLEDDDEKGWRGRKAPRVSPAIQGLRAC